MNKTNPTVSETLILSIKTALGFFVFFIAISSVPIINVIKAYENQIKTSANENVILFENVKINIEKVTEPEDQRIGLSKYSRLSENSGMFFVFAKNDYHSIWMHNMKFDIDIIWLDESLRVVDIKHNATVDSFPKSFSPQEKAKYVLEVNSGFANKNFIRVGEQATIFQKP